MICRIVLFVFLFAILSGPASPAVSKSRKRPAPARKAPVVSRSTPKKPKAATVRRPSPARRPGTPAQRSTARRRPVVSTWKAPTFADSTVGDNVDGEDLTIRRAAVTALGPYNGSVVVVDPSNGRILTIVNQKLALKSGFVPCSTIKVVATLAAMSEGICDRTTVLRIGRRSTLDLTTALARSNNSYFASLGNKLGFEKVSYYAGLFGLGEKAGLDIEGEEPGILPKAPPPGGVGMMTSFGEGISVTPLELASLLTAISNGGDMYYLQYPRNDEEAQNITPRLKRRLELGPWLEDLKAGMRGAVEFGTARRANYNQTAEIFGKTGTCTDFKTSTHMGWFGSFNENGRKLVVVVMLTGGNRYVNGPMAAGVAGGFYRNLAGGSLLATAQNSPLALVSTQTCCAR